MAKGMYQFVQSLFLLYFFTLLSKCHPWLGLASPFFCKCVAELGRCWQNCNNCEKHLFVCFMTEMYFFLAAYTFYQIKEFTLTGLYYNSVGLTPFCTVFRCLWWLRNHHCVKLWTQPRPLIPVQRLWEAPFFFFVWNLNDKNILIDKALTLKRCGNCLEITKVWHG